MIDPREAAKNTKLIEAQKVVDPMKSKELTKKIEAEKKEMMYRKAAELEALKK